LGSSILRVWCPECTSSCMRAQARPRRGGTRRCKWVLGTVYGERRGLCRRAGYIPSQRCRLPYYRPCGECGLASNRTGEVLWRTPIVFVRFFLTGVIVPTRAHIHTHIRTHTHTYIHTHTHTHAHKSAYSQVRTNEISHKPNHTFTVRRRWLVMKGVWRWIR
jgi:hypothetical protein